ncbi:piRNA biogenesis protein EXD1 [Osmerus eperlanus]|uniref:piRNA biogenesis protein EXD1 n=1 Tax=Osmerus eperlanus TaxID=29151 RepID=UPI002E156382
MTMDDFQFLDSFKRKQIKITLKTATFIGVVQRINLNKTVVLDEVVDVKRGRKFPGVKLFFGHEILNVEFPHASKSDKGEASEHRAEGHLTVAEFQPYRKNFRLDDDDNEENYVDFVVIEEFHEKFGPAVMHIRKQQVIGLGADGVGAFQHERLCWLQIATKNKVYLFDILLLGVRAFKNGLSMILENKHILKVTHDCRSITACLLAQFGVNLTNVFDTQVADVMCFYSESGGSLPDRVSTLQEVVSIHLQMPPSGLASLRIRSQITQEDSEVWYVRPCPVALLKVMALGVVHLLPLRLVLLDALMADYTGLVDSYLRASQEPVHTQHIGTSCVLELPGELRELEWIRRQRQERALELYPVTEQGLLQRSNPRAHTPPPAQTPPHPPAPPAQTPPHPPAPPAQTPPHPPAPPAQTPPHPPAPPAQTPPHLAVPPAQTPPHPPAPPAQTLPHPPAPPAQTLPHRPATPALKPQPTASGLQAPVDRLQPRDIRTASGLPPVLNPATPALEARQILRKQLSTTSPAAPAGGLGLMEIVLDTMGRGRPLQSGASPSLPAFPALGQGLCLQAQVPTEGPGGTQKAPVSPGKMAGASPGSRSSLVPSPPQGGLVQPLVSSTLPGDVPGLGRGGLVQPLVSSTLPGDVPGLGRASLLHSPLTSPLSLSFRSFRNT